MGSKSSLVACAGASGTSRPAIRCHYADIANQTYSRRGKIAAHRHPPRSQRGRSTWFC